MLSDAQLWDQIAKTYDTQITELKEFQRTYGSSQWTVFHHDADELKDIENFKKGIEELEKEYKRGLKTLADTSRDLIQLVLAKYFPIL